MENTLFDFKFEGVMWKTRYSYGVKYNKPFFLIYFILIYLFFKIVSD